MKHKRFCLSSRVEAVSAKGLEGADGYRLAGLALAAVTTVSGLSEPRRLSIHAH